MPTAIQTIRNKRELFLIPGLPVADAICLLLTHTALSDGVGPIRIFSKEGLFFVGANNNWISKIYRNDAYVFDHLVPLAGQRNTFRAEILLPAFASEYAFIEEGNVLSKSNDFDGSKKIVELAGNIGRFCVVFRG